MGWGTDFNVDLYLNKETYNNIEEVEDTIEDEKETIDSIKLQLILQLVTKKLSTEEEEVDPIWYLTKKIKELFTDLRISIEHVQLLTLYKEFLKEKDES